jgi:16S rRNA (guanine527-N7)-methyltransferase
MTHSPRPVELADIGSVPDAAAMFASVEALATAYAQLLAHEGVEWGLIGPREVPRIWTRHLVNCAGAVEWLAPGRVLDLGSGAGLPGIPLALVRPEQAFVLVEPLARRVRFLELVVERLSLSNVEVVRARAEEARGLTPASCVVSRALAPLPRVLELSWRHLEPGGMVLALRGRSVNDEVLQAPVPADAAGEWQIHRTVTRDPDAATTVAVLKRRGNKEAAR